MRVTVTSLIIMEEVKNYVSSRNRLVQTSTKVGIRSYRSKTAF